MRYNLPITSKKKEKIFGNILDLKQFFWVLGGAGVGLALGSVAHSLLHNTTVTVIVFMVIAIGVGGPFAFFRPKGMELQEYLRRNREFKKQSKVILKNKNGGVKK